MPSSISDDRYRVTITRINSGFRYEVVVKVRGKHQGGLSWEWTRVDRTWTDSIWGAKRKAKRIVKEHERRERAKKSIPLRFSLVGGEWVRMTDDGPP